MPYFFLSYASADGDGYLDAFYRDLCEGVRSRTGLRAEEVGFRDQSVLQVGADWMDELATAVATARVFVALCSPSYFASDMCGREWQLFSDLTRERQPGMRTAATNLLPIVWIPAASMPDIARRLQYSHEDLGTIYRQEGLQFLARLKRFRDDYEMFVTRLAERIVSAGQSPAARAPIPVSAPSLEDAPSAFGAGPPGTGPPVGGPIAGGSVTTYGSPTPGAARPGRAPGAHVGPARAEPPAPGRSPRNSTRPRRPSPPRFPLPGGPRHVHFVVVAPPAHRVGHVRGDTQFYGPTAYEWAPYKPQFDQRVCVFAQNVASTNNLTSALATAESSIIGLLADARERNELVVLLVDVWATKLQPYQAVLIEYDELNAPTSAVMVPWSDTDGEIRERADELHDDLHRAFPNNMTRGDDVFRSAIATHQKLQVALEEVLAVMQSRIVQVGTVMRRAGGERTVERPVLTQPEEGAGR